MSDATTVKLIANAYHLLGDGNGNEWADNPEYTRGIVELLRDTVPTFHGCDRTAILQRIREIGLPEHRFTVIVHAATHEQAQAVMNERICVDEDYGFRYDLDWIE